MSDKLLDLTALALNCIRWVLNACFFIVVALYMSPIVLMMAIADAFAWAKKRREIFGKAE
jgi:hypothetical protein